MNLDSYDLTDGDREGMALVRDAHRRALPLMASSKWAEAFARADRALSHTLERDSGGALLHLVKGGQDV